MSDNRHPDIEIYVKNCSPDSLHKWLQSVAEQVTQEASQPGTHAFTLLIDGHRVPVLIHEKVAGKAWTSVWFKENHTPWEKDIDCARAASTALETQIRCIASGWNNGDDPDEWWKVEGDNEELITWLT
ncbi:hypothetical protein [Neptunomonas sp. XY-337]|uniref:hypothetical protein n=1 Tax=Neptunomonas sp. XY-337 TaxID=2561897 RepID=UPI0010A9DDC4|nr:hypothetical protein [Neptunomonas sp. XY-337]